MSENSTLRIHTQLGPAQVTEATSATDKSHRRRGRLRSAKPKVSFGDRLLRNSAIACTLLLGILALGNVHQPWAEKAAESVQRALSMHIDLDDSIGDLKFVKQLMPESALVFLNVSGDGLTRPCEGAVVHPWNNMQPWVTFEAGDRPVCAAGSGTVTAVSSLSDGRYGLIVDHGEGLESVYASLDDVAVQSGDSVNRGQRLGSSAGGLYFELRQSGDSIDPAERLGL